MQGSNADIHVNLSRASAGKKLHSYINKSLWMDIALAVPALFLVRLPIFVNLYVIGPAYVCAMMKRKRCGFISAFMAGCGLFLLDMPSLQWKYGALLLLLLVAGNRGQVICVAECRVLCRSASFYDPAQSDRHHKELQLCNGFAGDSYFLRIYHIIRAVFQRAV